MEAVPRDRDWFYIKIRDLHEAAGTLVELIKVHGRRCLAGAERFVLESC